VNRPKVNVPRALLPRPAGRASARDEQRSDAGPQYAGSEWRDADQPGEAQSEHLRVEHAHDGEGADAPTNGADPDVTAAETTRNREQRARAGMCRAKASWQAQALIVFARIVPRASVARDVFRHDELRPAHPLRPRRARVHRGELLLGRTA
jgi:hypothetical protein